MNPLYRFEFYIPTAFPDKTPIPASILRRYKNDLIIKYKGLSIHPNTIEGYWSDEGEVSTDPELDNLVHLEILAPKHPTTIEYFENLKRELMTVFNQKDIFMIYYEVSEIVIYPNAPVSASAFSSSPQ